VVVALCITLVILFLVWKKVPAAIGRSLDKKIEAIREQLNEAESIRKDAEALKAEYEAKAVAADKEAAAMVERAKHEAEAIIAKATEDSEALIERRKAMAEAKIAAEERAAIDELRSTTARVATAVAAKLIAERGDAGADKKLVDEAISSLSK
jgi:F-type H+-transporting ATPase subunit b